MLKWYLVRYLHPEDHNPAIIRKIDRYFARELDFKDMKFPAKIRNIHKILKKELRWYYSKNIFKRYIGLLLIGEEGKRHYVHIKGFNTFMCDHTLHRERKRFCF